MAREILFAAFDLDGTILERESSWVALHRHFGTTQSGERSLKLYSRGKIDYREFMRRDIGSWPKPVTRSQVVSVLSGYKVRKEAPEALSELRRRGIDTALVTSGIDILAEMVAEELGIRHWVANGLQFDRNERVKPEGVGRVDPTRKDRAYLRLLRNLGVDPLKTIAVGDTVYDLAFLKSAALGFMLAHSTRVDDPSVIHIDKLTDIFDHF
jgi:phosphoserine phosphatase